jgi:hypothetical protein
VPSQCEELARRSGVDSRDSPIPVGPVGRVPTSDAAWILVISKQETRALAAAELIPAVRDHRGCASACFYACFSIRIDES